MGSTRTSPQPGPHGAPTEIAGDGIEVVVDEVAVVVDGVAVHDVAELRAVEAASQQRSTLAAWYLLAALGLLQVLDVLSTKAVLGSGGSEANPVMAPIADGLAAPLGVKAAALDAIDAGIKKLVILTEHIPVQDVMYVLAAAREAGARVLGPNTAGLVTTGQCFVGFMPAFNDRVFKPGRIGVISRSGSLGTLVCLNLVQAGFGVSSFIGIGGDPIIGTTTKDALQALDADDRTQAIAMVGEIGGAMEEEAADYAAGMTKPVAAFIAGAASPPGKKMGHAGAIVMGDRGSYAGKKSTLEAAGVEVVPTPSGLPAALAARMATLDA